MKCLWPLLRLWLIFFYSWAAREIHPLHPDVPHITRRLRDLKADRG